MYYKFLKRLCVIKDFVDSIIVSPEYLRKNLISFAGTLNLSVTKDDSFSYNIKLREELIKLIIDSARKLFEQTNDSHFTGEDSRFIDLYIKEYITIPEPTVLIFKHIKSNLIIKCLESGKAIIYTDYALGLESFLNTLSSSEASYIRIPYLAYYFSSDRNESKHNLNNSSYIEYSDQDNYFFRAINSNYDYSKVYEIDRSSSNLCCIKWPIRSHLIIPKDNPNYIEFTELLEYCCLYYLRDYSKFYKLTLTITATEVTNVELYRLNSNHQYKLNTTLYSKELCRFVDNLFKVVGALDFRKHDLPSAFLDLYIDLTSLKHNNLEAMTILNKYVTKYGKIEDIFLINTTV